MDGSTEWLRAVDQQDHCPQTNIFFKGDAYSCRL